MLAAALTAVALSASAPVPVTGGTAAERSIVRSALAALDPGAVTSAAIDRSHYLVLGPPARRVPNATALRAQWEARAVVVSVAQRFAAAGDRLVGYRIAGPCGLHASCGSGGSLAAEGAPAAGAAGVQRLRATVLANAKAAGVAVRTARVLPIGGGVLSVVVRLREDQLLDAPLQTAISTLFGQPSSTPGPLHFISIEAPDGTAVGYGGTYANGGGWNYGGDTGSAPIPRTYPGSLARARTDLTVVVQHGAGNLAIKRTFRFVCGAGAAQQGDCRRLFADRWALLVPMTDYVCAGSPLGAWDIEISGTFAGQSVSRGYNGCYGATGLRWARFLGITR